MAASIYKSKFVGYQWIQKLNVRCCPAQISNYRLFCHNYLSRNITPLVGTSKEVVETANTDNVNSSTSRAKYNPAYPDDIEFDLRQSTDNTHRYLWPDVRTDFDHKNNILFKSIHDNNFSVIIPQVLGQCSKTHMLKSIDRNTGVPRRNYSENGGKLNDGGIDGGPQKRVSLHLMDFPEIVWPSIIKSLRNWILTNLVVTPYFDREFNLPDFVAGSKKAVEVISECLSRNDYTTLQALVSSEVLEEVKRNVSSFSVQQRQELAICPDDIYFSFPYQVGVMFNDDEQNQKRFVEITMCYHVLQGLNDMKKQGITPPLNMGMMPEYRDKIHICNYRFIREFTKGVEDEWTVNVVNHFKPSDYVT